MRGRGDLSEVAIIVCDMWDAHHCVSAARRVAEMAPHMNEVLARARERGALVIHAPSECMAFYEAWPERRRAQEAPRLDAPVAFDWNRWDAEREAPLPRALADPGPCSCDAPEPCCDAGSTYHGAQQIATIEIAPADAITDDGQEVFNLLGHRTIDDVIIMGVHTNVCVLARPFGIRQLVYLGKRPCLCRDLTDSFHRDPRGHFRGTEVVIEHIELHWCPTVTSDELVGGEPFRFWEAG